MGVLADRALRRVHTGLTGRTFTLTIAGIPFTDQVKSLNINFDPAGGGSACQIEVRDSLEGLEDARVEVRVGYGDTDMLYFAGYLQEPGNLAVGKGAAYGPFKLMSDQFLGQEVRYQGVTLAYIFKDLENRAGYTTGQVEISGGDTTVDSLVYTEETSLTEVAKAVADPAKYVMYDRPGYKRRVMPTPQTGVGGRHRGVYTEQHYPTAGFTVTENRKAHYSKVVVFRRNTAGGYDVRAEVPVAPRGKFKPPANRISYVSDFPGNALAAQQTAYDQAHKLAFGEFNWALTGIWLNPEIEPWDAITVEQTEIETKRSSPTGKAGRFVVSYRCLISGGLSVQIGPDAHHMDLSGAAVRIAYTKLPDPIRVPLRELSPGIVRPEIVPGLKPVYGLKPNVGLKPRRSLYNYPGGIVKLQHFAGLKPNVGLKPNTGLKPKRDRLGFV